MRRETMDAVDMYVWESDYYCSTDTLLLKQHVRYLARQFPSIARGSALVILSRCGSASSGVSHHPDILFKIILEFALMMIV